MPCDRSDTPRQGPACARSAPESAANRLARSNQHKSTSMLLPLIERAFQATLCACSTTWNPRYQTMCPLPATRLRHRRQQNHLSACPARSESGIATYISRPHYLDRMIDHCHPEHSRGPPRHSVIPSEVCSDWGDGLRMYADM